MQRKTFIILGLLTLVAVMAILALTEPSWAGKLEDAIAKTPQGVGKGMIDANAKPGFMGIPGAPQPFLAVVHLMGCLGRLDFFLRGRLRRHHGRGGTYLGLRSVGFCLDL